MIRIVLRIEKGWRRVWFALEPPVEAPVGTPVEVAGDGTDGQQPAVSALEPPAEASAEKPVENAGYMTAGQYPAVQGAPKPSAGETVETPVAETGGMPADQEPVVPTPDVPAQAPAGGTSEDDWDEQLQLTAFE